MPIIQRNQAAPGQMPAAAPQQGGQGLSPDKQKQAEQAFQMGDNMMWRKQTFDAIMGEVQKDPVNGISDAVVMILTKVREQMGDIDPEAAMLAGLILMTNLVASINETGRVQITPKQVSAAVEIAVEKYLQGVKATGGDLSGLGGMVQSLQAMGV